MAFVDVKQEINEIDDIPDVQAKAWQFLQGSQGAMMAQPVRF